MAMICLALTGCGQSWAASLEHARASALSCVERQVPNGTTVPPSRAQEVVADCDQQFGAWSRAMVEEAFEKRLDGTDRKMANAYNRVLKDQIELMQLRISDGPHQDLPAI